MLEQKGWLLYFTDVLLHLNDFSVKNELLHFSGAGDSCVPAWSSSREQGRGNKLCSTCTWPHGRGAACTGKHLGIFKHAQGKGSEKLQIKEMEKFCKTQEREESNGLCGRFIGKCDWDPFLTQICLSAWDKAWFVLQQLLIEELHFLRKRRSKNGILAKFVF